MSLSFLSGYVLGQQGTQSARLAALTAGRQGTSTSEVLALEDRLDRLVLVIGAMWSLLEERGFTNDDLIARIHEIDKADGLADGRRVTGPSDCRECGSKVAPGLQACQFCGAAVPTSAVDPFAGA